jgi:hypothetical protein
MSMEKARRRPWRRLTQQKLRHLTGRYMLRAFGARATKKPSRAAPFVGFFSATFCPPLKPLRGFFIAAVKTSYTAGTLYAIKSETYGGGGIHAADTEHL